MQTTLDMYCVMGNPVAHSRSPWIHARFAQLTQQALDYRRRLVPLQGFAEDLQQLIAEGGKGCNVTVPFKLEAAQAAHSQSPRVALAGAANTLVIDGDGRIHADNTDGLGLVADITRNAGVAITGKDVLLIGAGGAAAGVLGPLLEQQPRSITICNRTFAKAQTLVEQHAPLAAQQKVELLAQELQALEGDFDIVINATAASLQGAGTPVTARVLRPGCLAYDMMYGAAATPFLAWAQAHGATGRDGLGMLVEQAAESFALWRGVRPPSQQVLEELREVIAQETKACTR
ncbi:shikimate dehydrogenase [Comamonas kerstersii]|uniref:Shikimate dehydrogenase (NADP(+)) n=1 Tax=Comamonas kerstersii TaxID=225992 RepID=A0A0W7YXT8_9BURK|nr:shikimate dehydrogenase [Comamonas kerstersii]KUF39764.1 shikimate dehydrogenase [Comamonas kerstersii]